MRKYKVENNLNEKDILLLLKNENNKELLMQLLKGENITFIDQFDIEERRYDLIITDIYYFKKYKTYIKNIKEGEQPNFLPLVLLSAQNDNKNIYYNNSEIIDEMITKPVDKILMANRIENLLKTRKLSLLYEKNHLSLAENSPIGITVIHNNNIKYINPTFLKMCGIENEKTIEENIYNFIKKKHHSILKNYINKKLINMNDSSIEVLLNNPKEQKWVEVRISDFIFKGLDAKLLTFSDITDKKKANKKIKHLSFHDKLTGLYNRAFFEEELKRLNTKRKLPLSIIMGDMNGLKMVNDAFGHASGDELLKVVSDILKDCTRQEDIVARIGGDEFGVLLPNTNKKEADHISERIIKSCKKKNKERDINPIDLSIAIGVSTKHKQSTDINDIFSTAEDRMYRSKISESHSIRHSILSSLEKTLQEKTNETKEHAKRMEKLSLKLGNKLNLTSGELDELRLLARLHDIGKVAVPEKILNKPDNLTDEEFEIVKNHPESGYRIVKSVPALAHVAQGVLTHHERWDGNGYPQGLSGDDIPYISRIISVVDTYDVMTHERSYKDYQSKEEALQEIQNQAGKQFDPNLVEIFSNLINK